MCAVEAESDCANTNAPPAKKPLLENDFFRDLFAASGVALVDEVNSYLISPDSSDDILNFWKVKSQVWPHLASVARFVLAIPATETSSERVFSLAGRTIEDRRTQLNADTVDDLLFLHGLHRS
jgi:hypothetical protein